jgi:carbon storage regulator
VLDVRGDQVRIGIKAPRSVDVHREEVYIALRRDAAREGNAAAGEEQVIDLSDDDAVIALPRE